HRPGREQDVLGLGDGAPPVVLVDGANVEVFEVAPANEVPLGHGYRQPITRRGMRSTGKCSRPESQLFQSCCGVGAETSAATTWVASPGWSGRGRRAWAP